MFLVASVVDDYEHVAAPAGHALHEIVVTGDAPVVVTDPE